MALTHRQRRHWVATAHRVAEVSIHARGASRQKAQRSGAKKEGKISETAALPVPVPVPVPVPDSFFGARVHVGGLS